MEKVSSSLAVLAEKSRKKGLNLEFHLGGNLTLKICRRKTFSISALTMRHTRSLSWWFACKKWFCCFPNDLTVCRIYWQTSTERDRDFANMVGVWWHRVVADCGVNKYAWVSSTVVSDYGLSALGVRLHPPNWNASMSKDIRSWHWATPRWGPSMW